MDTADRRRNATDQQWRTLGGKDLKTGFALHVWKPLASPPGGPSPTLDLPPFPFSGMAL
jgi:hypothetical protein